ncbi:MAG TPA: Hsp70 family protein [Pseudomonadales bacterium]|jgi:molecular chaperone DnaK|nr:Hsp70 family protein [Pseudomonadales bacterium]
MSTPIIGIDLGTTFTSIATVNEAGRPEIIPSMTDGCRSTASAIWFNEDDNSVLIGADAVEVAGGYPDRVVRWVKRHMGDPNWIFSVDGEEYSAVDLSALIIKKLVQEAEKTVGKIQKAVITVPAYFDEVRRKATIDAAEAAGIEVIRVINEPTAAALAYASTGKITGKCLIFDFGGGTFDVSIVDINSEDNISVVASDGDHQLGGKNVDELIAQYASEQFEKEHGIQLLSGDTAEEHAVMLEAEKIKISLSKITKKPSVFQKNGKFLTDSTFDRALFERLISPILTRLEMLVDNCLAEAGISENKIEHVLLVGGSTRIPAITELLSTKFNKDPICSINPDESVALGAALQAGILLAKKGETNLPVKVEEKMGNMILQDVTAYSYGTLCIDPATMKLVNQIIIPKNTKIPVTELVSNYTISEDQQTLECSVTQGEDTDPEFVTVISQGEMSLPPGRPARQEIKITYQYDANGMMSCEFHDLESSRKKSFELNFEGEAAEGSAIRVAFNQEKVGDLDIS